MKSFTTSPVDPSTRQHVTFKLDGRKLRFVVPKMAGLLRGMTHAAQGDEDKASVEMLAWVMRGLDDDDRAHVQARLDDDDDALDIDTMAEIAQFLLGTLGGRPNG